MNLGLGVDALRLWAESVDYTGDVSVGTEILKQIGESLRKLRNTSRFMLSNSHDLKLEKLVPYRCLNAFDKAALSSLHTCIKSCDEAYEAMNYQTVFKLTKHMCAHLSGSYLEVVKDRLYNNAADCPSRRSAQTTLVHMLNAIMMTNAPIVPHLMEELYSHAAQVRNPDPDRFSVFQQIWDPTKYEEWNNADAAREWAHLQDIRQVVNVAIEQAREQQVVKGTVECSVSIKLPKSAPEAETIRRFENDLADVLSVATCNVVYDTNESEIIAVADKSQMHRCGRCWKHTASTERTVCGRCSLVLKDLDFKRDTTK